MERGSNCEGSDTQRSSTTEAGHIRYIIRGGGGCRQNDWTQAEFPAKSPIL